MEIKWIFIRNKIVTTDLCGNFRGTYNKENNDIIKARSICVAQ